MKKIIFLVIMILGVAIGYSQNTTLDKTLKYDETILNFVGTSTDVIGTDSTWTYTVKKKSDARLFPYIYGEIDSTGGTAAAVYIIRQEKMTGSQSYTNKDTVTWYGTTDTTFVFDVSTATKGSYQRVLVKGSTSTFEAEIQKLEFYFPKY